MSLIASYAILLLSAVFLVSGLAKTVSRNQFRSTLTELDIVPRKIILPFSIGLPVVEIIVGILLLVGWRWPALIGAAFALALLLAFTAAAVYAMRHGKDHVNCACFGPLSKSAFGRELIVRNAALSLLAAYAIVTAALEKPVVQIQAGSDWLPTLFLVLSTFPVYMLLTEFLGNRNYYTSP